MYRWTDGSIDVDGMQCVMQVEGAQEELKVRRGAEAAASADASARSAAAAECAAAAQCAQKAAEASRRRVQVAEGTKCTAAAAAKVKRGQLDHRAKQRRAHEGELRTAEAGAAAAEAALEQAREKAAEEAAALCAPTSTPSCA